MSPAASDRPKVGVGVLLFKGENVLVGKRYAGRSYPRRHTCTDGGRRGQGAEWPHAQTTASSSLPTRDRDGLVWARFLTRYRIFFVVFPAKPYMQTAAMSLNAFAIVTHRVGRALMDPEPLRCLGVISS